MLYINIFFKRVFFCALLLRIILIKIILKYLDYIFHSMLLKWYFDQILSTYFS